MSRSWERMVTKNTKKINKQRKKTGKPSLSSAVKPQIDRFVGRNYVVPTMLIMLIVFYVTIAQPWSETFAQDITMFWVTVGCYVLLALFYFFRRPYLAVSRDTLETRKFTGYKTLRPGDIRKFSITPGYILVESVKGSNWVFSRTMNLYPLDKMSERLKTYADLHNIAFETKAK